MLKRILFLIFFCCIAFSCEKEYYTTIPNYEVLLELKLATLDFELNTNLAYKTITQPEAGRPGLSKFGYGGVLVINGFGESLVNLYAFDLACPEEAQRNIRVVPDNMSSSSSAVATATTATCPKCGAVFNIAYGTGAPQSGSKYYLRSYKVSGNGMLNSTYTVHN